MELKRVYVYKELYDKIMSWGKEQELIDINFKTPNGRTNFPYYLEKYLEKLKVR